MYQHRCLQGYPIQLAPPELQTNTSPLHCPLRRLTCAGVLQAVYDKAFAWCAVRYQAAVARELKKYGLRFDDLLDEDANLVSCNQLHSGLAQIA